MFLSSNKNLIKVNKLLILNSNRIQNDKKALQFIHALYKKNKISSQNLLNEKKLPKINKIPKEIKLQKNTN